MIYVSKDELNILQTAKQTTRCTNCLFSCLCVSNRHQLSKLLYMPLGHVQCAVVIRRHAKTFCKTPPRELQLTLGRRLFIYSLFAFFEMSRRGKSVLYDALREMSQAQDPLHPERAPPLCTWTSAPSARYVLACSVHTTSTFSPRDSGHHDASPA